MEENQGLSLSECGGSLLVARRLAFDLTNRYIFCCVDKSVKVITIESGECLQMLDHDADVVGVALDEQDITRLLTCTVDGIVSQWEYEDGVKLKQWAILQRLKVLSFIVPRYRSDTWFVTAESVKGAQVYALLPRDGDLHTRLLSKVPDDLRKLSIHNKGHFMAYAVGRTLFIRLIDNEQEPPKKLVASDNEITIVACHSNRDSVAVGDTIGRIYVWHKVLGHRPIYTLYHWHQLPVADIAFSSEGTVMYSGGEEMVVVRWSLHSSSKEETKDFLPRTGAKIRFLETSADGSLVGTCLDDNSILIASSQLKILHSITGFIRYVEAPASDSENNDQKNLQLFPAGLIFDGVGCGGASTKGTVLTNGRHGHLQFYDPISQKQKFDVDVIGRNVPPAERGRQLSYAEVVQVAVCRGWLATVDYRADTQYSDEMSLKFWKYDSEKSSFKLNTWIDRPHSEAITSLFFGPLLDDQLIFVSTSKDGKFKLWELLIDDSIYASNESWICEHVGSYRDQPALCGDFSIDGQLAIGFGRTLTLWNIDEFEIRTTRCILPVGCQFRQIQLGTAENDKHLVVVLSDKDLTTWDLTSQLCLWRVTTVPDVLCKHIASGMFAAFFGPKICLFRPSSPDPEHVMIVDGIARVLSAAFEYDAEDKDDTKWKRLYFITNTQKIMCLGNNVSNLAIHPEVPESAAVTKKTPFAELLSSSKASKRKGVVSDGFSNYETNIKLLSGPAHALPSVGNLGPKFVESCLGKKESKTYGIDTLPDPSSEITFAYLKTLYSL